MVNVDREQAADWARAYGRTWEDWDIAGFVDLFSEDVVYVEHPTGETVVGRAALEAYVQKEQREQGAVTVHVGAPIVEGSRLAGEFWAVGQEAAIAGAFVALLDAECRCTLFREYWFELDDPATPYPVWGD